MARLWCAVGVVAWLLGATDALAQRTSLYGTWVGAAEDYPYTASPFDLTVTDGRCAIGISGFPNKQNDRCDQDHKKGTIGARYAGRVRMYLELRGGKLVGAIHTDANTGAEKVYKLTMIHSDDVMQVSSLGADEIRRAVTGRSVRIFPTLLATFGTDGQITLSAKVVKTGPYLVENGRLCVNWPDYRNCWAIDRRGAGYVFVSKDAKLLPIE